MHALRSSVAVLNIAASAGLGRHAHPLHKLRSSVVVLNNAASAGLGRHAHPSYTSVINRSPKYCTKFAGLGRHAAAPAASLCATRTSTPACSAGSGGPCQHGQQRSECQLSCFLPRGWPPGLQVGSHPAWLHELLCPPGVHPLIWLGKVKFYCSFIAEEHRLESFFRV